MKQETMEVLDGLKAEIAQLTEEIRQLKEQAAQQQPTVIHHHHYSSPYILQQPAPQPWQPFIPPWKVWCGVDTKTELVGVINQS